MSLLRSLSPAQLDELRRHYNFIRAQVQLISIKVDALAQPEADAGEFVQEVANLRQSVQTFDALLFKTFRLVERLWDEAYRASNPPEPQPSRRITLDDLI